ETGEQVVAVFWVDLGDAQAVANGGVGGGPTALAQNAAVACEVHNIVNREEIGLVGQVCNDGQVVVQLSHDLIGDAGGIAAQPSGQGFLTQILGGSQARGHDLLGILVLNLFQRKTAPLSDAQGFSQQWGGKQIGQPQAAAQVAFGIGVQVLNNVGDGLSMPDGGQRVMQGLARTPMHLDTAQRHQGDAATIPDFLQDSQMTRVGGAVMQAHPDPQALGEDIRQSTHLSFQVGRIFSIVGFENE